MKFSVIVNNYNYGRYLNRAIASVVKQTLPASEIIVVDDGSTDHSLEVARQWAARNPTVQVIAKPNGGQLSSLNTGFLHAHGDILCFLDADDEYSSGYLQRLEEVYTAKKEVNFIFCLCELAYESEPLRRGRHGSRPRWERVQGEYDCGLSFLRTVMTQEYFGGPTSSLSGHRSLFAKFLPFPHEQAWRIRADDVLVFGAATALGRKYQLAERLVRYHVHGNNLWYGSEPDDTARLHYEISVRQLIQQLTPGLNFHSPVWEKLPKLLAREFRTLPHPRLKDALRYAGLISECNNGNLWSRFFYRFKVMRHYARRRQPEPESSPVLSTPETAPVFAQP